MSASPSPSEEAERNEQQQLLAGALSRLPPRERLLISLYYDDELTMKEISQIMHVSESRVCQLHAQAVLRLRGHFHVRAPESAPVTASSAPTRAKALARAS